LIFLKDHKEKVTHQEEWWALQVLKALMQMQSATNLAIQESKTINANWLLFRVLKSGVVGGGR